MSETIPEMNKILGQIEQQVKKIDEVNANLNNFVAQHMALQREEMKKVHNLVELLT